MVEVVRGDLAFDCTPAGNEMTVGHRLELLLLFAAARLHKRATRRETACRWGLDRRRHLTGQHHPLAAIEQILTGHSGDQRARVGMARAGEDLACGADL